MCDLSKCEWVAPGVDQERCCRLISGQDHGSGLHAVAADIDDHIGGGLDISESVRALAPSGGDDCGPLVGVEVDNLKNRSANKARGSAYVGEYQESVAEQPSQPQPVEGDRKPQQ